MHEFDLGVFRKNSQIRQVSMGTGLGWSHAFDLGVSTKRTCEIAQVTLGYQLGLSIHSWSNSKSRVVKLDLVNELLL